jgi:hypothetical protein
MTPVQTASFSLHFVAFTAGNGFGGEFSVASIFSDEMALQRGEPVPIWGYL